MSPAGEVRIVRGALVWGALAAVPAAGVASLVRGRAGALAVLAAAGLVLANAGLAALVSARAGRRGAAAAAYASLPSFAFRMLAMLGAMAGIKNASSIDEPTFALTFGIAVMLVLVLESRSWKRTPWLTLTYGREEEPT